MNAGISVDIEVSQSSDARHKDRAARMRDRHGLGPEALERFVYLVGTPRSGTTVITKSFYLSDRVFSCPNPTRFTHRVWRHRNKVDARLLNEIFKMPKFYRERQALRTLDEAERDRVERRIRDAFASGNPGRMYQLYPLVYSLDPECERSVERAVCWADKGNDVYGLFDIARTLPQAKFIFIIRDPRATVASMKSQTVRSSGEEGSRQANLNALLASCLYWRNMMQTFLRLDRRYPGRAMFLRFEDFVEDADETINRALEFATGERMQDEALQSGLAQFRHKKKHERKRGRVVEDFGIDREPLERWRSMLDENEIELATALTWRTARKLGYEIAPPRRRFAAMRVLWRLKGWPRRAMSAAKLAFLGVAEWITPPRAQAAPASAGAQAALRPTAESK